MANGPLFTAFRFEVKLEIQDGSSIGLTSPLCNAAFAECDGLEMTMAPKTVQEGGFNTKQTHLVGPVTFGTLSLKRGMTNNFDLWTWFSAAAGPTRRGAKASGAVIMRDGQGAAQVTFKLFGCLPVKLKAPALNAKDGLLAIEEMQIAYSRFEVQPGGTP